MDSELGESVCTEENVSCFPTVKIFIGGEVVDTVEGAKEDQVRKLLLSDQSRAPLVSVAERSSSELGSVKPDQHLPASRMTSVSTVTELRLAIDKSKSESKLLAVVINCVFITSPLCINSLRSH